MNAGCAWNTFCWLLLLSLVAPTAIAADVKLTIDTAGTDDVQPVVSEMNRPNTCCKVAKDSNGEWFALLGQDTKSLVTSFKVSTIPSEKIVAVRLDLPSFPAFTSERLVLRPPEVSDGNDRTVLDYYSTRQPAKDSMERVWGYLQDLNLMIEDHRRAVPSTTMLSASRVRAAYMFMQSIVRLGVETWYVVHPDYVKNIKFADELLHSYQRIGKCLWLGRGICTEVPKLREQYRRIEGYRVARIWKLIQPDPFEFDTRNCTRDAIQQMFLFYDYFLSKADSLSAPSLRTASGLSEDRIAKSLATCTVNLVTCGDATKVESLDLLAKAESKLSDAGRRHRVIGSGQSVAGRVDDVREITQAVENGLPLNCLRVNASSIR